jgi:hypothetical protein
MSDSSESFDIEESAALAVNPRGWDNYINYINNPKTLMVDGYLQMWQNDIFIAQLDMNFM